MNNDIIKLQESIRMLNDSMQTLVHNAYITPLSESILDLNKAIKASMPVIEFNEMLKPTLQALASLAEVNYPKISFISNNDLKAIKASALRLDKISKIKIPQIELPEILIPKVEELVTTVNETLSHEDKDEVTRDVTSSDRHEKPIVWTWDIFKWFLGIVISVVTALYIAQQTSYQAEQHHQENIEELRKISALSEQQLLNTNEKLEQLENLIYDCLESIEPFLLEHQDNTESDLEHFEDDN